jgi:lactoylglutathione lyase
MKMKYLHTMIRVTDPEASLRFFDLLGLRQVRRMDNEAGRFSLYFLAAPGDEDAQVELTHNWDHDGGYDGGRNFGHLAYRVEDIYATCQRLMDAGVTINRPPRDGRMAFVRTPDAISIELLQQGEALPAQEPWSSMGISAHGRGRPHPGAQRQLRVAGPRACLRETVVIDPAVAEPVLAEAAARGWHITQIWNTHWHPDHTGGNDLIKASVESAGEICVITGTGRRGRAHPEPRPHRSGRATGSPSARWKRTCWRSRRTRPATSRTICARKS